MSATRPHHSSSFITLMSLLPGPNTGGWPCLHSQHRQERKKCIAKSMSHETLIKILHLSTTVVNRMILICDQVERPIEKADLFFCLRSTTAGGHSETRISGTSGSFASSSSSGTWSSAAFSSSAFPSSSSASFLSTLTTTLSAKLILTRSLVSGS